MARARRQATRKKTTKKIKSKPASLVSAAKALARGDGSALGPLLAAWRERPSVALGDVIEAHGPADEVVRALAGLADVSTAKELAARVQALAALPPDPRVAGALASLVLRPPYTSQSMKPMWRSLFAQLAERHMDPRALGRLREARIEQTFGATNMAGWMTARLAEVVAALSERFAGGPPRLPGERALASLVPEAPAPAPEPSAPVARGDERAEQLLALCLASPEDDAPRLVYADLLAEQGEQARAELINLQIHRARAGGEPGEREQELVRRHAARWLAPIAPVLKKGSWVFERGFLDRCTIYPRKGKALELAGHPLWATVREVTLSETGDPAPIVTHSVMQSLRVVRLWTYPRGLAGLLESDSPVEELHDIYLPNVTRDRALWRAFAGCSRLPRLRLVQIVGARPEEAREIWSGELGRPGMRLVFAVQGFALGPWWSALAHGPRPGAHPAITVVTRFAELELDAARRALTCTLGAGNPGYGLWDAALALGYFGNDADEGIGRGVLKRFELRLPEGGVHGEYGGRPLTTPAALLAGIARHCEKLGVRFEASEGSRETRYIDRHPVSL